MKTQSADQALRRAYRTAGQRQQGRFYFAVSVGNLLLSPLYFAFDARWLNNPSLDPRHAERLLISHTAIVVLAALYIAMSLVHRRRTTGFSEPTLRRLLAVSSVGVVAVPAMIAVLNQLPGGNGSIVTYALVLVGLVAFSYEPVGFVTGLIATSAAVVLSSIALLQTDSSVALPNMLNVTTAAVITAVIYPLYDRFRLREFTAQQEIARLSDLRRTTLRALAHDVRLPIHAIRRSSAALSDVALDDPAARATLGAELGAAADQAERIVDNLTSLGQNPLEDELSEDARHFAAVSDVVQAATESVRNEVAVKHVNLKTAGGFDVLVKGQEPMLVAVVSNLLANAVKFSQAGGAVTVRCDVTPDTVALSVRDEGLGMDAETVDRLNRGERVPTTPGSEGEIGAGVGLSVARAFADTLGAQLAFASEPGAGSTVTMRMRRHREGP
jgi:signal transduction histidine kinase